MEIVLGDLQGSIITSEAGYRAYERIMSMLDFSLTPNGHSRMTMARRSLLLQEILNRIELPPESDIPGDDEVAHSSMKQWTIPDSRTKLSSQRSNQPTGLSTTDLLQRIQRRFIKHSGHILVPPAQLLGISGSRHLDQHTDRGALQCRRNRFRLPDPDPAHGR